jgi:hypothetical protein
MIASALLGFCVGFTFVSLLLDVATALNREAE